MSKLLLALVGLFVAACAAPKFHDDPRPIKTTAPEIQPYVADFEKTYGIRVNTPIDYSEDLNEGKVGTCFKVTKNEVFFSYRYTWIYIRYSFWSNEEEITKLALVYHELIHCKFGVSEHINTMHSDGCPTNLLNKRLPNVECLNRYWESYVNYWQ